METPIPWTTENILDATGGELLCGPGQQTFLGVSIDSRTLAADDMFIAIKGKVHDGHTFLQEVVAAGIRGVIVRKDRIDTLPMAQWRTHRIACVAVADTTRALGDMAAFNRRRTPVSVVAITGSAGKTTTREMTSIVASRRFKTLSSQKSFNNDIGLPLTLLRLRPDHRWAVLELGMNHPGEIARLAQICLPNIGVITNIGPVHLEGVGSLDGVMRAKGELLENMSTKATAVLNADDQRVRKLAKSGSAKVTLFGQSPDAVVRAEAVEERGPSVSFTLVLPEASLTVDLRIAGAFMVSNALAASAVGYLLGVPPKEIKTGLEAFQPVAGRMNIIRTDNGIQVVDDTYNANPLSMKSAFRTFTALKKGRRGALVLGDMLELGEAAEPLHGEIGRAAAGASIERLYITGDFAEAVRSGAVDAGLSPDAVRIGATGDILKDLKAWLRPDDWVLVKGSRAMGLEAVVIALQKWSAA